VLLEAPEANPLFTAFTSTALGSVFSYRKKNKEKYKSFSALTQQKSEETIN
jgi:hypothetical protein